MRKVLLLLAFLPFLFACSSTSTSTPTKSIEDVGKERAESVVREFIKSKSKKNNLTIEYLNIGECEVVYSNDSICVIDVEVSLKEYIIDEKKYSAEYIIYKDLFESKERGKDVFYEYYHTNSHIYDSFLDLRERMSIKDSSVSFYNTLMGMVLMKGNFKEIK